MDRFSIDQVIRILGLSARADQADGGNDFDVACRIALNKIYKAKHYEDLAEKGLLVELPCKVGDTVWCINKNNKQPYCETVGYFYIDENGISFINKGEDSNYEFGKDAFILCAEAEQALKEM